MGDKLNLNFTYTFNGKIWNIISHPKQDFLLIEVREQDKFMAKFSVLDLSTNRFIVKDILFDEMWWIGASFFTGTAIIFHTFPDQENPQIKDYFIYNILTGKVLWELKGKTITDVISDKILAVDPVADNMECYDLLSGQVVDLKEFRNEVGGEKNKSLYNPFHYQQGGEHFQTVSRFVNAKTGKEAISKVDYYENDQVMVISYYFMKNTLANDLLVVDRQGTILLNVQLGDALKGISDDTFFVYGNKLIFVKGNSNFLIYQFD